MRHPALPTSYTVENLAQWITENKADSFEHENKTDLDSEAKQILEHKSALASCKILELKEVEKQFKDILKKGTEVDLDQINEATGEPMRMPYDIQIPPTRGLDELTKNLQFYSTQLRDGYTSETVMIFLIPFPEENMMIGVDITGEEWPQYTREMSEPEKVNFNMPILKDEGAAKKKKSRKNLDEA